MPYWTFFSSSCAYVEVLLQWVSRNAVWVKRCNSIDITRYCQPVLKHSCSTLQSHQHCMEVPDSLNSQQFIWLPALSIILVFIFLGYQWLWTFFKITSSVNYICSFFNQLVHLWILIPGVNPLLAVCVANSLLFT